MLILILTWCLWDVFSFHSSAQLNLERQDPQQHWWKHESPSSEDFVPVSSSSPLSFPWRFLHSRCCGNHLEVQVSVLNDSLTAGTIRLSPSLLFLLLPQSVRSLSSARVTFIIRALEALTAHNTIPGLPFSLSLYNAGSRKSTNS